MINYWIMIPLTAFLNWITQGDGKSKDISSLYFISLPKLTWLRTPLGLPLFKTRRAVIKKFDFSTPT